MKVGQRNSMLGPQPSTGGHRRFPNVQDHGYSPARSILLRKAVYHADRTRPVLAVHNYNESKQSIAGQRRGIFPWTDEVDEELKAGNRFEFEPPALGV